MRLRVSETGALLGLIALAALVKFSVIAGLAIEPVSDASSYMNMVRSFLDTGLMDDGHGNVAFYSSGYPLFLVPFFALFGVAPESAQIANALLGVLAVFLIYLCAKEVLPDWRWAVVPALVWITYPPALIYTEYVAKENLLIVILLLQTYLLFKFPESGRPRLHAALLGINFGCGLLVAASIILTAAIVGLVLIRFQLKTTDTAICHGKISRFARSAAASR